MPNGNESATLPPKVYGSVFVSSWPIVPELFLWYAYFLGFLFDRDARFSVIFVFSENQVQL